MAGKAAKHQRYRDCMTLIRQARETGTPADVKEKLEHLIGVAKRFYDVDQLTTWLDFLVTEIDYNPEVRDFLREPYKDNGKLSFSEPVDRPVTKLKFKGRD